MSADELRKAAETLREKANGATEGPWRVCAEGSEGSRIAPAGEHLSKRERSRFIGILNGRVQPEDGHNARYIATMHPGVGLALADLLETLAFDREVNYEIDGRTWDYHIVPLARLINGGAS